MFQQKVNINEIFQPFAGIADGIEFHSGNIFFRKVGDAFFRNRGFYKRIVVRNEIDLHLIDQADDGIFKVVKNLNFKFLTI